MKVANRSSIANLSKHFTHNGSSGRHRIYACNYCGEKVTGDSRALHLWTKHRKHYRSFEKKEER